MNTWSPSPSGRRLPSSAVIDALYEDEEVQDIVALSGASAPDWLQHLSIPTNWQRVELPDSRGQVIARMAVCGALGNGEWQGADTISAFGYTNWLVFYDVFHNADRTLRGLDATGIAVRVMPVPAIQRVAAVRCSGTAVIGDRSVWIQQSNYVAGSEQPHASRLIVHSIFVEAAYRDRLAEDIAQLSDAVYQGFLATLRND